MTIQKFFISRRVEKLKNKRIRILRCAIGLQMLKDTSRKRINYKSLMIFKEIKSFFISNLSLQEIKNIQYSQVTLKFIVKYKQNS
jgi:hypothetical protein